MSNVYIAVYAGRQFRIRHCCRHTYKHERVSPPLLEHVIMELILLILLAHCLSQASPLILSGSLIVLALPKDVRLLRWLDAWDDLALLTLTTARRNVLYWSLG